MRDLRRSPTARVVIALVAGFAIGTLISASGDPALRAIAAATEPVGTIWINALRMTVIPLVVSLIVVSVGRFSDVRSAGRTGVRTFLLFAAFLVGSSLFAVLTVPALFRWVPTGSQTTTALAQSANSSAVREQVQHLPTVAQWFADLVPTNPIRAAADGTMLPLVIFCILFGLATLSIAIELREALARFFQAVSESMLTLVRWLIALAPIGVFALVLPVAARMGASAIGAVGYYIVVTSGLLCVQTIALYPIASVLGGVSVKGFAQAVFPAQAIAFSSRSSLASLPSLLEGAETKLQCPTQITGFVLPLSVSVFKINTPLLFLAGACFVARLYGVSLGAADIAQIVVAGALLSFGVPAVPVGGLLLLAPVFANTHLPVEGVGILMAVDLIPDISRTVLNVTADMAVATILSRRPSRHATELPHAVTAETADNSPS
jgi:proton glutamate symport protein